MDTSYVLFKTYTYEHQAEMDLTKLKSEGIEAYLTDKNMGSFSFFGVATGGVKLHVDEGDIEQAQRVLSSDQSEMK